MSKIILAFRESPFYDRSYQGSILQIQVIKKTNGMLLERYIPDIDAIRSALINNHKSDEIIIFPFDNPELVENFGVSLVLNGLNCSINYSLKWKDAVKISENKQN